MLGYTTIRAVFDQQLLNVVVLELLLTQFAERCDCPLHGIVEGMTAAQSNVIFKLPGWRKDRAGHDADLV